MSQNQHYVPQFYLKYFSKDNKNVNIYNLSRQEVFLGPLSKQCAKPNFYSENQEIEKAFSLLEGKVSSIFRKIIENELLTIDMQEYVELSSFILWQSGRTNKAGQDMLKHINDIFDFLKPDLATMAEAKKSGLTLDDFKKVKLSHKSPALETSNRAITSAPLLFDLQMALLINKSNTEFIISDSPTILFNTFFNGKSKGGQTGYASKGLQLFFPLTPKLMIILYDPKYYFIPLKENLTYKVQKNKDIRRLNGLQLIFGFYNIYFNNYKESDLKQHFNDLKYKREKSTIVESLGTRPVKEGYSELIHFAKDNAVYDLTKLSFLTMYSDADVTPGVRDLSALEEHRKYMKKQFPKMEK